MILYLSLEIPHTDENYVGTISLICRKNILNSELIVQIVINSAYW